ncbi:MAG: hypothetical protein RL701_4584 [Pseudomonadota bacterium]
MLRHAKHRQTIGPTGAMVWQPPLPVRPRSGNYRDSLENDGYTPRRATTRNIMHLLDLTARQTRLLLWETRSCVLHANPSQERQCVEPASVRHKRRARGFMPSCAALLVLSLMSACSAYDPSLIADVGRAGLGANGSGVGAGGAGAASATCLERSGPCARPNAVATCVDGECLIASCDAAFVDCDDNADNGCEANLESPEHCGICNAECRFSHAAASCTNGQCALAECDAGYGECDGDKRNGCERSLRSISDCGQCDHACPKPAYATAACNDGVCAGRCEAGHGDCNGKLADGCEQPLTVKEHCGACNTQCNGANVSAGECQNGRCIVIKCATGFADCNGDASDGCEANLGAAEHCGSCGATCDLPHVADTTCAQAQPLARCQIDNTCNTEQPNCNATLTRGCEAGHADCDGRPDNGCEADLQRLSTCGACGRSCVVENTTSVCKAGECVKTGCIAGADRCNGSADCKSLLSDANNCGKCGQVCSGSTPYCAGGKCSTVMCDAGRGDCDGASQNSCETDLNEVQHCGGCDVRCAELPHATAKCAGGKCAIGGCAPGFADCDQDPSNGCEVNLNTQDDCGACGRACLVPQGEASCVQGECKLNKCRDGREDCNNNLSDGCETDLRSPESCGTCDNSCTALPNVAAPTCTAQGCATLCKQGFADCNAKTSDGCETNLTLGTSCGSCSADCGRLPHVQSSGCSEGACRNLLCEPGFGECDGDAANGCERSLMTTVDCGACDRPCAPAHAQGDCGTGQCSHGACDTGFGDCDGVAANGCEASLGTADHCGSCGNACAAGVACLNGRCGCTVDDQCGTGQHCCSGQCLSTAGECFAWPCIPGTQLNQNRANCGACGALCITFCCGPLL